VRQISQEIKRLDSDARSWNGSRLSGQEKQLVDAFGASDQRAALPAFLRDLTGLLPQDAWLQALNMDAQGVELIGQAGTASALIPALEPRRGSTTSSSPRP